MALTRNELIEYGVERGYPTDRINKALNKKGFNTLGPRESALIEEGGWGKSPVKRFGEGAKATVKGLNTIATLAGQFAFGDKETKSKMVGDAINYLSDRGVGGALKDAGSMLGMPYGLTEENIKNKGLATVLAEAPFKAWAHPFETTLDIGLPIAGRLPAHSVGNALARANAPRWVQSIIPSEKLSNVNSIINTSRAGVMSVDRAMARQLNEAIGGVGKADMVQVVKNLQIPEAGKWTGSEATLRATKKMADISDQYNKMLVDLGVDASKAKQVSTAQYIMERFNPDRTKPVTVGQISSAMSLGGPTGESKALANALGISEDRLWRVYGGASDLFDRGIIKPISHRATFMRDERVPGAVSAQDKLMDFMADRRYGKATPEELAPTVLKAYEQTGREMTQAQLGKLSMEGVVRKTGRRISPDEVASLGSDEIVISPRAFNDIISKDFQASKFGTTNQRIIDMATKGLDDTTALQYADDLYAVRPDDIFPLVNMASSTKYRYPLLNKLNSMWKTAQLITPKYVIENRLGNTILNAIEGVTPWDYWQATKLDLFGKDIRKGKFYDIKPEQLKADTSYYGVLGEDFQGTRAMRATKQSLDKIKQGVLDRDLGGFAKGTYDLFSAPTLAIESMMEGADRYANFIRQAKRLAKERGVSVEELIKQAGSNNQVYADIMGRVNKSLGDYTGRNWAINPQAYALMSLAFPFFKYPAQGVRTLAHQAMTRPGNFASKVTLPSRIGRDIWDRQVEQYPEIADERGGVVTSSTGGMYGITNLLQSDVNPLGAGAGLIANALGNWEDIGISPFFALANLARHQDRYGNIASSPRYTTINRGREAVVNDPRTGLPTAQRLDKPELSDRLGYALSTLGNLYSPPVIAWNRYIGPGVAGAMGKQFYPKYDTSLLGQIGEGKVPSWLQTMYSGKTSTMGRNKKQTIQQQLGGLKNVTVYPSQSVSTRDIRSFKSAMRKYRRSRIMKDLNNGGK